MEASQSVKNILLLFKNTSSERCMFHIGPKSLVKISGRATLSLNTGRFMVNASWSPIRKRVATAALILEDNARLVVNGNFTMYEGSSIFVARNAVLELGRGSFINTCTSIDCYFHITIGDNCYISDYVRILDSDNHSIIENNVKRESTKPVIIEDNVWIGKNAIILKGVTVGTGAVIAAGAIVTRDVAPGCLVAGNPARLIKQNIKWE